VEPRIQTVDAQVLVGKKLTMSLANNRTGALWQSFMPWRAQVPNAIDTALYSLQVYPPGYFAAFDPAREFVKWAGVAMTAVEDVPEGLEQFLLPAGLYAVFHYQGSSADASIYQYIFSSWLPASPYELDARPHFEMLGDNYRNNDPTSEEDIYIPIRPKNNASLG